MALNGKALLAGHLDLKRFDTRVLEFNDLATGKTDQVIMMLVMTAGFITCLAIAKMSLFRDTALGKELQSAVHRCITDSRVLLAQAKVKIFGRKMRSGAQELLENELALMCGFQSLSEEKILEFIYCFAFPHSPNPLKMVFILNVGPRQCQGL